MQKLLIDETSRSAKIVSDEKSVLIIQKCLFDTEENIQQIQVNVYKSGKL